MGFITWICIGFTNGLIARPLVPGKDPGGILLTAVLGMKGAVLGGCLATILEFGDLTSLDLRSLLIAVGGAWLFLVGYLAWAAIEQGFVIGRTSLEE